MEKPVSLPSVKIVYELPILGDSGDMYGGYDSWKCGLTQEDVDRKMDLQIRLKDGWVFVEKYYCRYLRENAETGERLPPVGEWQTVFMLPESRVIYIKTTNVAFAVSEKGTNRLWRNRSTASISEEGK